ncbi:hypothetical protein ACTXT7_003748 [Hymenolepis weldensis]
MGWGRILLEDIGPSTIGYAVYPGRLGNDGLKSLNMYILICTDSKALKTKYNPVHLGAPISLMVVLHTINRTSELFFLRRKLTTSPKNNGLTPLHMAAQGNHEEVARNLIARGASLQSATGALFRNERTYCMNIGMLILTSFAKLVAVQDQSFLLAGTKCPLQVYGMGIESRASRLGISFFVFQKRVVTAINPNSAISNALHNIHFFIDFLNPLHVAAHCGNVKVAKVLIDKGCDMNARALNGFTPLHIACKKNKIPIVELLLNRGAQISSTTEGFKNCPLSFLQAGLTPLHVAAFIGSAELVRVLLERGASVEQTTMRGETPLHLGARSCRPVVAELLLTHGAAVDAKAKVDKLQRFLASPHFTTCKPNNLISRYEKEYNEKEHTKSVRHQTYFKYDFEVYGRAIKNVGYGVKSVDLPNYKVDAYRWPITLTKSVQEECSKMNLTIFAEFEMLDTFGSSSSNS